MEEMCMAKREGGVPSLCALVNRAPSRHLPVLPIHKPSETSIYVFLSRVH